MSIRIGSVALAAILTTQTVEVYAQSSERIDTQLDRLNREILPTTARGPVPMGITPPSPPAVEVDLVMTLPGAWTSNAGYADDDEQDALHFTPSAQLRVTRRFENLVLKFRTTASIDSYSQYDEYNLSFFAFRVEASAPRPLIAGFTPYLRYQPRIEYSDADFSNYAKTLHDFTVGGTSSYGAVAIEIAATRRESSSPNSERTQIGIAISTLGAFGSEWSWSLSGGVNRRWYSGGTNEGREDIHGLVDAAIIWKPHRNWELRPLQITFEANDSNPSGNGYVVLNIGSAFIASF